MEIFKMSIMWLFSRCKIQGFNDPKKIRKKNEGPKIFANGKV